MQAPQVGAVLAGHLLPDGVALVVAERDLAIGLGFGEEDAPAVVGHRHVAEVRPALLADVDRGAEEHGVVLERSRARAPPTTG